MYTSNSKEDNNSRKATVAGTPARTGTARNIGNTSSRRDLNSSRKGSNSRDSQQGVQGRNNNGKNTSTAGPPAAQEAYGAAGDAKNSRDIKTCGNIGRRFINNSSDVNNSREAASERTPS